MQAVVRADPLGEITFVSDTLHTILGAEISDSKGQALSDFLRVDDIQRKRFTKMLEITRDLDQNCVFMLCDRQVDDEHSPLSVSTTPLSSRSGYTDHILVLFERGMESFPPSPDHDLHDSHDSGDGLKHSDVPRSLPAVLPNRLKFPASSEDRTRTLKACKSLRSAMLFSVNRSTDPWPCSTSTPPPIVDTDSPP
eukprot:CAMPEP_0172168190 /NCGR_PEP_ID=MMETSP1050-20130122/9996_1 /TAXON_ID=233186 /ORGANISM="Cryptomonas curvata, Strain CCAP979/52" /LENGTH=194 /DNA_ID=CAMNT_0012839077 /DNA_START=50 /DNA_END=630 /DNA_ORIENTATION=-